MVKWLYGEEFVGMRNYNGECINCDFCYENHNATNKLCSSGCKVFNYISNDFKFGMLPK